MKIRFMPTFLLSIFMAGPAAMADTDIMEATLLELADIKSTIAQKREMTMRESSGIVSIITREQIAKSGVRDLKEALKMFAPGISFGGDVEGITGIAVRGLFGHEGKVLLMMDGVPMNEEVYSTIQYANHHPAEMIERVEVLRGPGSITHGNYALIGAINVITRRPVSGYFGSARYSQMSETYSHRNLTLGLGGDAGELRYSLIAVAGEGHRSQDTYTDTFLDTVSLKGGDRQNPKLFNLGLEYKGFSFRTILDKYVISHHHLYTFIPQSRVPYDESYETRNFHLQYKAQISDSLEVTPYLQYRETYPYRIVDARLSQTDPWAFSKYSKREVAGISADWQIDEELSLLAGSEISTLKILSKGLAGEQDFNFYPNGLTNQFFVTYAESTYKTENANFVLGGRYERPLNFPSALVPRVGINKSFEKWHYKLMASQSYRVPAGIHQDRVENAGERLKPEIATNYEVESGYKISSNLYFSLNVFDIKIKNPITYDPTINDGIYYHGVETGTRGFESELHHQSGPYEFNTNVAYYQRRHFAMGKVGVPGHADSFIAMPNWRVNIITGYRFTRDFGMHPSATYESERYGFIGAGGDTTVLRRAPSTVVYNLNFQYTNIFVSGLDATIGLMNITNREQIQYLAYDGGFAPLPGHGRALSAMIGYTETF